MVVDCSQKATSFLKYFFVVPMAVLSMKFLRNLIVKSDKYGVPNGKIWEKSSSFVT